MGSYSHDETTSTFSETNPQQNHYPHLELSDQNNSGSFKKQHSWPKTKTHRRKKQVFLEGYVETPNEGELVRSKSLTDEDLEELKGCLDLGFGFSYDEIPELCNTLPALELCYSISQKFLDEQQKLHESSSSSSSVAEQNIVSPPPIANWKICSPECHVFYFQSLYKTAIEPGVLPVAAFLFLLGDRPEDVKARLKYWAQVVACTVRLCN